MKFPNCQRKHDSRTYKVAILWRGDAETRQTATPQNNRFYHIFEELATVGINAEPAVDDEAFAENCPRTAPGDAWRSRVGRSDPIHQEGRHGQQKKLDQVFFGATVTYADGRKNEKTITIVGIDQADFSRDQVSWVSPGARALMKAHEGDIVDVRARRRGSSRSKCSKSATAAPAARPNRSATFDHRLSREAWYCAPLAVGPAVMRRKLASASRRSGVAISMSVLDSKLEPEPEQVGSPSTLRATRRRDRRRSPISSG
jgi:hypothetical protein